MDTDETREVIYFTIAAWNFWRKSRMAQSPNNIEWAKSDAAKAAGFTVLTVTGEAPETIIKVTHDS